MGTSLLTNSASMTALKTLRELSSNMDNVQERVSTGKRVNKAADNSAYWSISSMMQSDKSTLSAVSDGMALGKSQISTANTAVNATKGNLDEINKSLATIYEKGEGDVQKIQKAVGGKLSAIKSAVSSSTLAEKNIIANEGQTVRVSGSYRREGESTYVDMIEVGSDALNFAKKGENGALDYSEGKLKLALAGSTGADAALKGAITAYEAAIAPTPGTPGDETNPATPDTPKTDTEKRAALAAFKDTLSEAGYSVQDFVEADLSGVSAGGLEALGGYLQDITTEVTQNVVAAGAELGVAEKQIDDQIGFVANLMDAVDRGVGAMVDADMNAESARLASLQVQQQLAIQALSIANQNSQNLLSLFRG
ncbi:MAG: Flagellin A [Candidatus Tokpelaia hoelldobleri]|uniref:Flagellin n=1 Tax=Candidatus Tokpelaia hoelldobleri TaxID=1902579 RepID=A0A1U9JSW2_9HYPH|nr:MAG: Flagellin A [Candidatus Tokpelaia hoelldoblerii]